MNNKNKQQVKMSNLLEKQKHINFESIDDPTIINYLRLYEALVDQNPQDIRHYINDLMDEKEAEKRVKYRYLIEAIAKEEKIDFTQKEVEDKAKEMAENYGITPEELIEAYGSIEVVKYDMKMHRALEILKESNK